MTEPTNASRAARAKAALEAYVTGFTHWSKVAP